MAKEEAERQLQDRGLQKQQEEEERHLRKKVILNEPIAELKYFKLCNVFKRNVDIYFFRELKRS